MFVYFVTCILSLPSLTSACLASGICGGGCGGGGGYVPPPMPSCNPGCGQGYGCGSYGCYRLRAKVHSSKTLAFDTQTELAILSPNAKFQRCCEDRHLPDECMNKCSYDTYTKETLRSLYFKTDKCPQQAAADIHFCAAQGHDHTECCQQNAVHTTLAGGKCLTFCDQRVGQVKQLDFTYLVCYHRFDQMKSCFTKYMTEGDGARLPPVAVPAEFSEDTTSEAQTLDFTKMSPMSKAKTFRTN